jgi:hypothetical protein
VARMQHFAKANSKAPKSHGRCLAERVNLLRFGFGVLVMEYRAHFLRRDGDIAGTTTLVCDDEAEAIEHATRLVGRFGIELLSGDRVIERLDPKREPRMAWA